MKLSCDRGSQSTQDFQDEVFGEEDVEVRQDNDEYADYYGDYSKRGNYLIHDTIHPRHINIVTHNLFYFEK